MHVPLNLAELQARWLELMHALAGGLPHGQMLALALAQCVSVAFQAQDVPALLCLETRPPSACVLVQQEGSGWDGSRCFLVGGALWRSPSSW